MRTGDANGAQRRVCLLTGAGGTLGDAFCRTFADRYDIVAVCGRRAPTVPSQEADFVDPLAPASAVAENAKRVYTVHADLARDGECERVVELALARHGQVDLLVNAAAYSFWPSAGLADGEAGLASFDQHFGMNVGVPLRLAVRLAQRCWRDDEPTNRARNRNVVNVSSLAGSRVFPVNGQGVYAASKAALNQLTRYLAAEFATFGVRVNGVAPNSFPGIVATDAVAGAIARLDASDVHGRILALDGPDQQAGAGGAAGPAADGRSGDPAPAR